MLSHELSSMKLQSNATTWYACSVHEIQIANRHIV